MRDGKTIFQSRPLVVGATVCNRGGYNGDDISSPNIFNNRSPDINDVSSFFLSCIVITVDSTDVCFVGVKECQKGRDCEMIIP